MDSAPITQGTSPAPSARERLLEAALKIFARQGYDEASTREITEAAGTNVASINYYFGSKVELYTELVRTRARACQSMRMNAVNDARAQGVGIEGVFRAFIHVHLSRSLADEGPDTDMALFFHELTTQGPGFEIIMKEMIHPSHQVLTELLMENYPGMSTERATLCIGSLMAQVVHFIRNRPVMKNINALGPSELSADALCDHIIDLTFHGLDKFSSGEEVAR